MPELLCCANCFGDVGLEKDIIPSLLIDFPRQGADAEGQCDYCRSVTNAAVPPASLQVLFEMLVDIYVESSHGRFIIDLLKEDWNLFTRSGMADDKIESLISDILDDSMIVRRRFIPSSIATDSSSILWEDLRSEMMHRNRWLLDSPIDLERLNLLLDMLGTDGGAFPNSWYRARRTETSSPLSAEDMGAPPPHLAGNGRANPPGIRCLYLGSTPNTSAAEIRPHPGELVCIAEFDVPEFKVADLRDPRSKVSPFLLADSEAIGQLRADLPLLERLGDELTKPVRPGISAYAYAPSQYLCELIKKRNYDGVLYRSSISSGINLALFSPGIEAFRESQVVHVDSVTVSLSSYSATG